MSDLIVITYDTEDEGYAALNEVEQLQKQQLITLEDAAVAVMNQKGKVKVKQTLEKQVTGSAAAWGFFWGLLIGLLFLFPLAWGLFGAVMGGIFGKARDVGIDNKFIKEVGNSLEPGNSALFLLVIEATGPLIIWIRSKARCLQEEEQPVARGVERHAVLQGARRDAAALNLLKGRKNPANAGYQISGHSGLRFDRSLLVLP